MKTQIRYAVYSLVGVSIVLTLLLGYPEVNRSRAKARALAPAADLRAVTTATEEETVTLTPTSLKTSDHFFQWYEKRPLTGKWDVIRSYEGSLGPWRTACLALTPRRTMLADLDAYYRRRIAESKKPFQRRVPLPLPDSDAGNAGDVGDPPSREERRRWRPLSRRKKAAKPPPVVDEEPGSEQSTDETEAVAAVAEEAEAPVVEPEPPVVEPEPEAPEPLPEPEPEPEPEPGRQPEPEVDPAFVPPTAQAFAGAEPAGGDGHPELLVATVAGVFAVFGLAVLLNGLAWLLYELVFPANAIYWGFFVVAGALFVLAGLAAFLAARWFKRGAPPTPDMAIDEAQRIRETLSGEPGGQLEAIAARAEADGS